MGASAPDKTKPPGTRARCYDSCNEKLAEFPFHCLSQLWQGNILKGPTPTKLVLWPLSGL